MGLSWCLALAQEVRLCAIPWLAHGHWRLTAPWLRCNDLILLHREKSCPANSSPNLTFKYVMVLFFSTTMKVWLFFGAHTVLWNIPKAEGSRNDFIKPSILEGNTHQQQHNSRHSVALRAPRPCTLRGCTLHGTVHHFAHASVFYFIQSSQWVRGLVSICICAT